MLQKRKVLNVHVFTLEHLIVSFWLEYGKIIKSAYAFP